MKLGKLIILAVILIFVIGIVPSLVARDMIVEDEIVNPPPGDNGGGIIEGDPWDDNNDDDPGNSSMYPAVQIGGKLIHWSFFRFWFVSIKTNMVEIEQIRPAGTGITMRKPTK